MTLKIKTNIKSCNVNAQVSKNGNSMDNADYTFTTINFFKTTALAITRQTVEQERNKLYNN